MMSGISAAPGGAPIDTPKAGPGKNLWRSRTGHGVLHRGDRLRPSPREILHVGAVVRHTVRDDRTEGVPHGVVLEAPRRAEDVAPVQATLELAVVRDANPPAVHAELLVVHGIHDLDLGSVEDVDLPVVHLPHEDLVRPALEPSL